MLVKIISIVTFAGLGLLVALISTTTPATAGPFGILAIFLFAYTSSLGVMTYFLYGASRVVAHLASAFTVKKPLVPLSFKRAYYFSTVIAAGPIMLIGLQSVGSIGLYEIILVLLFVVLGCVYISKRIR